MDNKNSEHYIVGIGTSAGGLQALETFFSNMPADSGLGFVVIQHLSPDYKSHMVQLLSKYTAMSVFEAEDGARVEPNCIYLIPPKKNMTIFHRKLYLRDHRHEPGLNLPIDIFLRSLAEDQGEKAIAIIMSGTGSDGTRGLRAIKEAGGMVMAQDDSAKFDGMPRSAIATQLVDYILPPQRMPSELLNFIKHPCLANDSPLKVIISRDDDTLSKIFALLRTQCEVDFTYYKPNTVIRRIEHRMSVNQIEKLDNYLHYLYQVPSEVRSLYKELLIGVTKFFRDTEAFEFLQQEILPLLFEGRRQRDQIRVWVASCSTGEEAYSLAILLQEYMEQHDNYLDVKIFATDIDQDALDYASRGIYPESIAADASWERLRNFFVKKGDTYEIMRHIREMVIFAQQNLITDPPFSKIDLISCRNVLIYFQPVLQKKVLSMFQFALKPNGFLFLGSSETVGDQASFFLTHHNKWKVYQNKGFKPNYIEHPNIGGSVPRFVPAAKQTTTYDLPKIFDDQQTVEKGLISLIEDVLPPCVIIDENYDVMHAFGDIRQYLELPTGYRVSMNLLKMSRQDLSVALSTALHKASKDKQRIVYKNVKFKENDEVRRINLIAKPILQQRGQLNLMLVIFEPSDESLDSENMPDYNIDQNTNQRISDLEQELQHTKENLQATIEEFEVSNEELQATNEELLAANEELQSTNEELQSVNEELITVNSEYQAKIQELTDLNNDINNLFNSTDIGTIFLDDKLRIRKFTPAAQKEINLLEQDIGRPLSHISHNIQGYDLPKAAERILKSLENIEQEVQNTNGEWYRLKLMPYRTMDNAIRGVVITLVDITARKRAEFALQESEARFRSLSEATLEGIVFIEDSKIIDVNKSFTRLFGYEQSEIVGQSIFEIITPEFEDKTKENIEKQFDHSYEAEGIKKDGSKFPIEIYGRQLSYQDRVIRSKAIRDISDRRRNKLYRSVAHNIPNSILCLFDHDLRYTYVEGQNLDVPYMTKENLEGKTIWEVFPEETTKRLEAPYRAALEGKTTSFEVTINSHVFLIHTLPMWDEQGDIPAGILIAQDVTTQHQESIDLERRLQSMEVLLVEDQPEIAKMVQRMMPTLEIHRNLHFVADGQEALAFLFRRDLYETAPRPDLIILDLNLPDMSGLDILAEMRENDELNSIPVMILTSSTDEKDLLAAYNLNTSVYLNKPFNRELLVKALQATLDRSGFMVVKNETQGRNGA